MIENIRSMSGTGVLADRKAQAASLNFRRFNLIYGFNGSGKSTLSRTFASLQAGRLNPKLPAGCSFEFQLSDGSVIRSAGDLGGLEQNLLVFNADFIEENLRWAEAAANPVFYIGREQAELAKELSETEAKLPAAKAHESATAEVQKVRAKALADFKTTQAKLISGHLREPGRRYEAPQLAKDYDDLDVGDGAALDDVGLQVALQACALDQPMPTVASIAFAPSQIEASIKQVRAFANQTYGAVVARDLQSHPAMIVWVKQGHDYHKEHSLTDCLLCGNSISDDRRNLLERALDDRLERFLDAVGNARQSAEALAMELDRLGTELPSAEAVSADLRNEYVQAGDALKAEYSRSADILRQGVRVLMAKELRPTVSLDQGGLPTVASVDAATASLTQALRRINDVIRQHNELSDGFKAHQAAARLAVRRHYVADSKTSYQQLDHEATAALTAKTQAATAYAALQAKVAELRSAIQEHGPAAEKMNKLIASYLGHSELSISAVKDGYEIHRRGKIVQGPPSEGEKTAIAICYFISMLEAEGRSLRRQIVVIDDPISSLDTKALNFACALLLNRLKDAEQVFILTHNQNCMNEFKKAWKSKARNDDHTKITARLLFLDVIVDSKTGERRSTLGEMSKFLREYDHEYHFLADHLFRFERSRGDEYPYGYMMPNVLRRVLDVFLAFRSPGSNSPLQKLEGLAKDFAFDVDQLRALERLAQVESHSDSLDDLMGFSSMTLEETRTAASALIAMMAAVDADHLNRLRGICGAPAA